MAGLASDDASGVCLRSLALEVDTSFHSPVPQFRAATSVEHGLVGHSIGLAAGPRPQLIPMPARWRKLSRCRNPALAVPGRCGSNSRPTCLPTWPRGYRCLDRNGPPRG